MKARLLSNLTLRKALVALVVVGGALGASVVYAQAAKVTTTYRTAQVTYGTISQTIGMAGNLAPVSQANLNFASSGTVALVEVQVGQTVAAGATLAALDNTLLSAQVVQAQATLSSAESKLAQDEAGGATTQSITSAENSVAGAQVSVNNAITSYDDTVAIHAQAVLEEVRTARTARPLPGYKPDRLSAPRRTPPNACVNTPAHGLSRGPGKRVGDRAGREALEGAGEGGWRGNEQVDGQAKALAAGV